MAVAEAPSELLFDEAHNRRLAEMYAPCFTLVLQLRASHEFGDAEVLRDRIKAMFARAKEDALRARLSSEEAEAAKFPLVAFIDETILSSNWSQKDRWAARTLQLELYNQYDAGDVFFDRLRDLLDQPARHAEVLEVYYLCMTLGFKGRYEIFEQDRLRELIDETYKALVRTPGMGSGDLSPHGKPRGQAATEVRSKVPVWMIVVFAVALGLLIYVGMSLYMNSTASSTQQTVEQVPRDMTP